MRLNRAGARQLCARTDGVLVTVPERGERQRRPITEAERAAFLEALGEGFSITHAARLAGRDRQRMYELRDADEDFASLWTDAWEQGTDVLEDELRRRALGYDEVTYDGAGKVLRRVHRFDTPAIVTALKARRPKLYRENHVAQVEVTGRHGGPVQLQSGQRVTTIGDVIALARELGVRLGHGLDDVIDGDAVELPAGELEAGS